MIIKNDIKYNKSDITKQFNELKNEIEFLINENFKLYLKTRNITSLQNYEKYYSIFYDNYKEYIIKNGGYIYSTYQDDEIIGILYINKYNYIDSLFIKEKYQNKKVGSNLLKIVLDEYNNKDITLTCSNNTLNFYRRLGFIENIKLKPANQETYQLIYKKQ